MTAPPLTAATSAQTLTNTYDALGQLLTAAGPQGTAALISAPHI